MTVTLRTITLPHGRGAGLNPTGLVSVYFAPRLDNGGTLGDYDEWIDWPTTVLDLVSRPGFQIVADSTVLTHVRDTTVEPDTKVWQALFPKSIPVTSPDRLRPTFEGTRMPEGDFAARLQAIYADLAANEADGPPAGADFLARQSVQGLFQATGALGQTAGAVRDFIGDGSGNGPGGQGDAQDPTQWDLHQWVSILGQYPELLRLMGIVIDFEVQNPPSVAAGPGLIATTTPYAALYPGRREQSLPTRYDTRFWWDTCPPEPGKPALEVDGFLLMGPWQAIDIDPLQSIKAVAGLSRTLRDEPGQPAALPALFENGWSLVRDEFADLQADRFEATARAQRQIEQNQIGLEGLQLCSDLLTTGYRVDVRVDGGPWRSLHQRTTQDPVTGKAGAFRFGPRGGTLEHVPADDEGWVQTTIVATDLPEGGVLRDQLTRWDGWSLSVDAIGNLVDPATGELVDNRGGDADPSSPVQFTVEHFVPRGTLPALQYGREYEFRIRLVDLSGVSRDLGTDTPTGAVLGPIRYGRWHPVEAPQLLRRVIRPDPGWGDTADTMVILSELDQDPRTIAGTDRVFFPPDTSWKTCELHGEPNGGHDSGSYTELTQRDALSLDDQTRPDPDTGEQIATTDPGLADGPEEQEVDYLTDPATDGVGFRGLPQAPRVVSLPYASTGWPERSSVRLVLEAGTRTARVVAGEATVQLPPAGRTTVTVGSTIDPAKLLHFGIFRELQEAGTPRRQLAQLRNRILAGQHWLFSGQRHLRMVHAVRLPLVLPVVRNDQVLRGLGDQDATIGLAYELDANSTREVTGYARWTDPIDVVGSVSPTSVDGAAVIGPSPVIDYDDPDDIVNVQSRIDFFDTKRHDLSIDAEVLARFSRYFTEETTITFAPDVQELDARGVVVASVRVRATDGTGYRRGPDFLVVGTNIERVPSGAITPGEQVEVTFVPLPVSRRTDEEGARPYELIVPNTVKPAPLEIDEVLPAILRTEEQPNDEETVVVHDGQVVRLWLDRPWYDTGTGEQVGVILDANPGGAPNNTRLARESVHRSAPVGAPVANNFPDGSSTLNGIGPGEVDPGTGPWDVVGHDVVFHLLSDRWACDIRIGDAAGNPVGYRPTARLVVSRFQPESLPGAWASPKRELDPFKLGVKRTIQARRQNNDDLKVKVRVTGAGHEGIIDVQDDTVRLFNDIEVSIQESDPDVADDDLRWLTVDTVVLTRTVLDAATSETEWAMQAGEALDLTPYLGTGLEYRIVVEEYEPQNRRDDDGVVSPGRAAVMSETLALPIATQNAMTPV